MNTKRRKASFRKWMLLPIFSVVTVSACVAVGCRDEGHKHEWQEHAATDSTCMVAGHELYYTCRGCELIFDAQKNEISAIPEKPLVPHEWGEGVKTADPTCTHGEEFTYTCGVGGETKKEYVGDPLGHTFGEYTYNDDATCVDEGTQSAVCSRCGETDYKSYPALGHEFGKIIPETNVKCQENLAAHYRCLRCEGYFNADREKTTLEKLTIPAVHNWQKTTTVLRHSLECLDCGKSYEGLHEFDSLSDFVCNDPDCAYERDHDRQVATWFESEDSVAKLNWDGGGYTRSFVTLPQEIGKPADALDAGDKALKLTPDAGHYEIFPVIRLKGVTDCLKDYNDADYVLIWTYLTGSQWADSIMLLGNTREDGIFYDGDPGQKYSDHTSIPKLGATGEWRAIKLTVAELKAALQKQGSISAEWAFIYFNVEQQTDVYLYSVELHRESAQAITIEGDAANYVTVADCAVPMSKVAFTVRDLPYGSYVRIIDDATGLEIHSDVESGTFVMPYAGVTVEVVDLFAEDALQSITTNVRRFNQIALPEIYNDWQDSCILTVLKNGSTVSEESYRYNAENGEVVFYEGGTYTLTYTLKKEGAADKTLTRSMTVHGALMSYLTEAERTAYYEWTPNVTSEYVALPSSVGKPAGAEDIGDYARKYEMNGEWVFAPVLYLGDLLSRDDLNGSDRLRIWVYNTSFHWRNENNAIWLGNVDGNGKFSDAADGKRTTYNVADETGNQNKWFAYEVTIQTLRAQLIKQQLETAEYLVFGMGPHNDATLYIYSVELYRETAREITVDDSAKDYVTVAQSAYPLDEVTVTVSGLEYGQSLIVMQGEEIIKTISVNGQTSFVMPSGAVSVTFVNVFENTELEEIATNIYRTDNIAIPSLFDGWYDSFTLTVKKGDAVVAASEYEYDEENHTILFVEGGTYELTYTLKKDGAADVELTRTVTVSGALMSFATEVEQKAYYQWANTQNEYVELPQEIGKPAGATDVGNSARKYSMAENEWQFAPVLYLGDLLSTLDQLHNGDVLRIWLYKTDVHFNNDNNFYWFADVDGDNKVPADIASDKKTTYRVVDENGDKNVWYAFDISGADLKTQLAKQGTAGKYLLLSMGLNQNSTVYIYSMEIVKASAQNIEVETDASAHITVAQSAYPLDEVTVTVSGLEYGQSFVIKNTETNETVKVISENGATSFVMPYGDVTVSFVNVFENTMLESITTNIFRKDGIGLPELFNGWYDSFTLSVKKDGVAVSAEDYEFDEENNTILFVSGGTYELTYMLKKEGAEDVELTRTVTVSGAIASFTTGADVAAEMSWGTEQYSSELSELPDEVKKPSQSVDVGNKAWKFTVENDKYYIAPTIYMGELLQNLNKLNNGDIIRIWIYRTGSQWAATNCYWLGNLNENGKFQTDIAGQQYDDKKDIPVSGTANVWYALDVSVADLKAQMIKQGLTSATYLQLFLNFDQNSTAYIYSLEIVKASAQTVSIDSTAQEHVSGLFETQLPLETVTFTVSGLGDGEAICVVNNSTNEKVLTVTRNGEASFVMPYAGVTVKIINLTSPTVVESFESLDSVKTITWSQESGTTRELVSAATEGIGTPDEAVKKGGNILKCTISGGDNWSAITVIKIGDLLQEPETLKDNDTVKIWVYFTDEHWDGTDVTNYYVGGLNADEKFDPIWDNRTGMTTATCTKGTWGAITLTGADLKAAAEKKSGDGTGWMYLQFNMNVNSVVYIYSVELYPA